MAPLHDLTTYLLQFNPGASTTPSWFSQLLDIAVLPIMIGWVMLFCLFIWAVYLACQDGIAQLKRLHQVPCDRCAYFTGNTYLKCTVHPCRAMSEEAIECLDFEPAQSPVPHYSDPCKAHKLSRR
ncbi:MAG: hypothetical protein AAF327_22125 [Cyanobacteria bacterium P01_A01_bin.37]